MLVTLVVIASSTAVIVALGRRIPTLDKNKVIGFLFQYVRVRQARVRCLERMYFFREEEEPEKVARFSGDKTNVKI
jgi:hypothetical protein